MKHQFGAIPHATGVLFSVWAPAQSSVGLVLEAEEERPMERSTDGFFTADVPGARPGQRYWFRIAQGLRPDPASRFQPEGPLGPSQVVDATSFRWSDGAWSGTVPRHRHVIYEMHIGTFTREGTYAAAMEHLPVLAELGVTTLELMPLADFAGRFGWGYDGVHLFAPTRLYGGTDDLRRFIDAAHAHGLAVILDVVYNHFGPVGNFLPEFSKTVHGRPGEWGDTINYDGEGSGPMREFMVENAAYWIRDFHFDGLRIDATHGIHDTSENHIVADICHAVRAAASGRDVLLVGESEPQDTRLLKDDGAYRDGLDAIWNEDWHHSAFVALTGRRHAYFTDYQGTAQEFASMARHGFLYQGQWYSWQKQPRGGVSFGLPGSRTVWFLENHDQVANTGLGGRLSHQVDRARWRAMTALLTLGPAIPLLFQGQEFGSSRPFSYFADHEGTLADDVQKGRLTFLAQFPNLATPAMRQRVPNPADLRCFEAAKLDDSERKSDNALFRLHRDLLHLRRDDLVLRDVGTERVQVETSTQGSQVLLIRYVAASGHRLLLINLADDYASAMNDPLLAPPAGKRWQHLWSSEHPDYDGSGVVELPDNGPWLITGGSATLLAS
jgi:maltooligosyltrehalose trehalohydrolase